MHKAVYFAAVFITPMLGTAKASASIYSYPPPQVVIDKLQVKSAKTVYKFFNVDKLSWYCVTSNRIRYTCYLSAWRNNRLKVSNARFRVVVKKGNRHTKLYEDISGTFRINTTRYGTLTPLDW